MKVFRFVIGLTIVLAIVSCQRSDDDDEQPVAAVYGKVLYQSDLQSVVYEGISRSDSIVRTKATIIRTISITIASMVRSWIFE